MQHKDHADASRQSWTCFGSVSGFSERTNHSPCFCVASTDGYIFERRMSGPCGGRNKGPYPPCVAWTWDHHQLNFLSGLLIWFIWQQFINVTGYMLEKKQILILTCTLLQDNHDSFAVSSGLHTHSLPVHQAIEAERVLGLQVVWLLFNKYTGR